MERTARICCGKSLRYKSLRWCKGGFTSNKLKCHVVRVGGLAKVRSKDRRYFDDYSEIMKVGVTCKIFLPFLEMVFEIKLFFSE